jgi:hypothetical protein
MAGSAAENERASGKSPKRPAMKVAALAPQPAKPDMTRTRAATEGRDRQVVYNLMQRQCGCARKTGGGSCAGCQAPAPGAARIDPASARHADLSAIPPVQHGARVYQTPKDGGAAPAKDSSPAASASAPGDKPAAPAAAQGACKVDHFSLKFGKWDVSWPWSETGKTTIALPVKFRLELAEGSKKSDCIISQDKKGYVPRPSPPDEFASWTGDSPAGGWWTGSEWQAGNGSWDWFGKDAADFGDEPGFHGAEHYSYPLYWGGVGSKGHFEFRTYVNDIKTNTKVRELKWGMLIDYSAPKVGKHLFFS